MTITTVFGLNTDRQPMHGPYQTTQEAYAFRNYKDAGDFYVKWKQIIDEYNRNINMGNFDDEGTDLELEIRSRFPGSKDFIPTMWYVVNTEYPEGDEADRILANRKRLNQTKAMKNILPDELPGKNYISSFFGGSKKRSKRRFINSRR